jgi:MATE family multidrug resistance protein
MTTSITARASNSPLWQEVQESLKLAIPLVIAQMFEAGIVLIGAMMMGLLGKQALAAGALGAVSFSTLNVAVSCILSSTGAVIATALGEEDFIQVRRAVQQSLILTLILSLPIMVGLWYADRLLIHLGQSPENVVLAKTYLQAITWGFPAAIGFAVTRSISVALNRPQFVTAIMLICLFLNPVGNYIFMFGKLGFPAMGLAGIGWSSTIVFWLSWILALIALAVKADLQDHVDDDWKKWDWQEAKTILRLGWPLGIQYGLETGVFTAIAFMMGYLGTAMLAAHEIAVETVHFVQMFPVGISGATMVRVARMMGQKDIQGARRASFIGIVLGWLVASLVAIVFLVFPQSILALYIDINNLENREVVQASISFLTIGTLVQLFYSTQVITSGALIGLQDTFKPMLISSFCYWFIGFGGGCLLTLKLGWGENGLWWGLAIGLIVAAGASIWRLYLLTQESKISIESTEQQE